MEEYSCSHDRVIQHVTVSEIKLEISKIDLEVLLIFQCDFRAIIRTFHTLYDTESCTTGLFMTSLF